MAEMRPIGIDQTTGQQRTVDSDDNVVNNIGDQIQISVKSVGDYSEGTNQVQVLYPWDTPNLLVDPASTPGVNGTGIRWSPNGEYLYIGNVSTSPPSLKVYQKVGTTLLLLDAPASVPAANCNQGAWSPNGEFLSAGSDSSPFLFNYQREGSTFTLLTDPASAPTGAVQDADWSPNGELLATAHTNSPFLSVYQRDNTTLNKIADPATLPGANGSPVAANGCRWAPNGEFLAVASGGNPKLTLYQLTSPTTLEKLADPASLPSGGSSSRSVSWSPDSQFLALVDQSDAERLIIYQRSGTTFTRLSAPASLVGSPQRCSFSPSGDYLAVTSSAADYLSIYQRSGTTFTLLDAPASTPGGVSVNQDWSPDQQFVSVFRTSAPYLRTFQTSGIMPSSGIVTIIGQTLAGS